MRPLISLITLLFVSTVLYSQDLNEILKAHYKAAATEKMKKVESIVTHGKNMNSMAGNETSFTIYQSRPHKIRIESENQGSMVLQTYNGEKGWIYAPMMGITEPVEMKGGELEILLIQSEFEDPLWHYKEKGRKLELIGENNEGTAFHLKLTTGNAEVRDFQVSTDTYQILSYRTIQVMGGAETEIEVILEDYKQVKGIPIAHKLTSKMNGQVVGTIVKERVEINKRINSSIFEKPVAK